MATNYDRLSLSLAQADCGFGRKMPAPTPRDFEHPAAAATVSTRLPTAAGGPSSERVDTVGGVGPQHPPARLARQEHGSVGTGGDGETSRSGSTAWNKQTPVAVGPTGSLPTAEGMMSITPSRRALCRGDGSAPATMDTARTSVLDCISPNLNQVRDWSAIHKTHKDMIRRPHKAEQPVVIGGGKRVDATRCVQDGPPDPKALHQFYYRDRGVDEDPGLHGDIFGAYKARKAQEIREEEAREKGRTTQHHAITGSPSVSVLARAAERHRHREERALFKHLEGDQGQQQQHDMPMGRRVSRSLTHHTAGSMKPPKRGIEGQPHEQDRAHFLDAYQEFLLERKETFVAQQAGRDRELRKIAERPYSGDFVQRLAEDDLRPPEPGPAPDEDTGGKKKKFWRRFAKTIGFGSASTLSDQKRIVMLPPNAPSLQAAKGAVQPPSERETKGAVTNTESSFTREYQMTPRSANRGTEFAASSKPSAGSRNLYEEISKCWKMRQPIGNPVGWVGCEHWKDVKGSEFLLHHLYNAGATPTNSPSLIRYVMQAELLTCVQRLSYGTNLLRYNNSHDSARAAPFELYAMLKLVPLVEQKRTKKSTAKNANQLSEESLPGEKASTSGGQRNEGKWVPSFCWSRFRHSTDGSASVPLWKVIGVSTMDCFPAFVHHQVPPPSREDEILQEKFGFAMLRGPRQPTHHTSATIEVPSRGAFTVFLLGGEQLHFVAVDPLVHNLWITLFDRIGALNSSLELTGTVKKIRQEIEQMDERQLIQHAQDLQHPLNQVAAGQRTTHLSANFGF